MKKINLWLRTIAFSLIFLGTLSSSAISGSVGNAIQGDDGTLLNGKFQLSDNIPLDVPLVGIKYVARNQFGITNTEGVFVYSPGSTVQFSIGDILLGQAEAKPSITIIDIVQNGTNSSNAISENITNFLLTLDDDGNPVNGITITEVVRALASSRSILFNQEQSAFQYDGNTQMVVSELTAATTAGPRTLYPHRSLLDALTANLAKIEPVPPPIGDTALPSARSFQRSDTEQLSTAQQSEDVVSLSIQKDCHLYDYGDDFPTNYAVPWNLFSVQHETIVKATCKQQSVLFDVAIGSEPLLYIWKKAYFTKDRETWQGPVDLKGSRETESGKWWVGNASIEIPYTQEEQQKGNFFSVFLCFRVNNEWSCGCKNERCNEEAWSLQAVKRPAVNTDKIVGGYYTNWTASPVRIRDVDDGYNLIYLFSAVPVGGPPGTTGEVTFELPGDGRGARTHFVEDLAYARNTQGRKIILSIGGAGNGMSFPNRKKSQTFVDSIETIYNQLGGFDGIDWNTFEADQDPDLEEMMWISLTLKEMYPGFLVTAPPAPWNQRDKDFCAAMVAAGAMDYAAPQYYDGPGLDVQSYIVRSVAEWSALLGPEHTVVGFGIWDEENYQTIEEAVATWNKIQTTNPNVRGVFNWQIHTDEANEWAFGNQLGPLVTD